MPKALLFDLDGTLLPMETEVFIQGYIKSIAQNVSETIQPDLFVKSLWAATEIMRSNIDVTKTNEDVFVEAFLEKTKIEKETIWPVFDAYYETVFPTLIELCQPNPLAKHILEEAVDQGYKVSLATNPIFPRKAIEHRMKWAGIDHISFDIVTVYEECFCTKPNLQYYELICEKMNVSPQDCIMIGNDMQEDMPACHLGMKTFLVEDYLIDRGSPQFQVDDRGSLEVLYEHLKSKQNLFDA